MTKRRGPGKPFQKGQSGNPAGRPKPAEQSELQRLVSFCKLNDVGDKILNRILTLAEKGNTWALNFFASRLWPEAFSAAKLNEQDGATNSDSDFAAGLRAVADAIRGRAIPDPSAQADADPDAAI